jgi:acyl phosphate:glycerol-3-phosphate acyltransferase
VAKGWIPTALFPGLAGTTALAWALAYGLLAVVGHVFSVFVGFRGGKGVATGAGVFLALAPWAILIVALVWGVTVVLTRIVSIGSILAALLLPLAVFATTQDRSIFWLSVALSLFVIHAHRENIRRLVRGEENRLGRTPESAR